MNLENFLLKYNKSVYLLNNIKGYNILRKIINLHNFPEQKIEIKFKIAT
jgi:hypothetical protein